MLGNKLIIDSDNALIKKAMKDYFICMSISKSKIQNLFIVLFLEGGIDNYEQLNLVLHNKSKHLLVFTTDKNIKLISAIKTSKNITLEKIGMPIDCIIKKMISFITTSNNEDKQVFSPSRRKNILTSTERLVLLLFIQGVTVANIAKRLNKNIKTVYTQKANGMNKLGFSRTIELIQKGRVLLKIHRDNLL
ncbi:TPA: helix-turn-helix transcriptional regulator [Enterobacter kobei]|nr:helix-turn-helix transcriptional regulator [Enterobacter kobei]